MHFTWIKFIKSSLQTFLYHLLLRPHVSFLHRLRDIWYLQVFIFYSFISSDIRRKRTKEDCYPQGPLQRGMQSQDLGKPQIPPTLFAGRDFGLYCLTCHGDRCLTVIFERKRTLSNTWKHRGVLPRGWGRAAPKERGRVERALCERGDINYFCFSTCWTKLRI